MVSLIVPCYNGERYIDRCIDSILAQTDHDIELILVNDGSTDKTDKIIKERTDEIEGFVKRFIYIVQENQGVGAACSKAFRYVTGCYLTLLDVDDVMLPDSIQCRRKWLDNHPEYGIVRTNGYYVSEDSLDSCDRLFEINEEMKTKENIFYDVFDGTTYVWPGSYMIRMSVLQELYPERSIYPSRNGQNLQFLMMAAYKSRAGFVDIPLMKYTIRSESLSHFSSGNVLEKEINAMLGYKDIRIHLVEQFVEKDQQEILMKRMDILYESIFVRLACKYNNKELAKVYYNNLKKMSDGKCNINTSIIYYQLVNPVRCVVLKALRRIGSFI